MVDVSDTASVLYNYLNLECTKTTGTVEPEAFELYSYLNLESTKTVLGVVSSHVLLHSYLNLESTKTTTTKQEIERGCTVT